MDDVDRLVLARTLNILIESFIVLETPVG